MSYAIGGMVPRYPPSQRPWPQSINVSASEEDVGTTGHSKRNSIAHFLFEDVSCSVHSSIQPTLTFSDDLTSLLRVKSSLKGLVVSKINLSIKMLNRIDMLWRSWATVTCRRHKLEMLVYCSTCRGNFTKKSWSNLSCHKAWYMKSLHVNQITPSHYD